MDTLGQTALHYAVMMKPLRPMAELLLEHGADPNTQTRVGSSPLLNAVQGSCKTPAFVPAWTLRSMTRPMAIVTILMLISS